MTNEVFVAKNHNQKCFCQCDADADADADAGRLELDLDLDPTLNRSLSCIFFIFYRKNCFASFYFKIFVLKLPGSMACVEIFMREVQGSMPAASGPIG